jgi:magnesium-transporting ATPase (P-type)
MTTVVTEGDKVYVFTKGASEVIVNMCHKHINLHGHTHVLEDNEKKEINEKIIMKYEQQSYRTLGLAYKIVKNGDWQQFLDDYGSINFEKLDSKMILLGIVGIPDPLRSSIPEAVTICQKAGITVRMVTGDSEETAVTIARQCGILPRNYKYEKGDNIVMTGQEFRTQVGEELVRKPGSKDKVVHNLNVFQNIVKSLRVLSRSSPQDKLILVTGLQQLNEVVSVIGDSSNDAPALKKSDVGFSKHIAGTQIAQEASDIILLDDNFASIVVAVIWGRNIYDCIRKFIQFQLTVNFVALTMCFVGSVVGGDSPITPIQMLWVNLIMDTFAALALTTEPPNNTLFDRPPVKHDDSLFTVDMIKTITGQSIYQITWLFFILYGMSYFKHGIFSTIYLECPRERGKVVEPVDYSTEPAQGTDVVALHDDAISSYGKCFEYTLFFQVFVMMQVFNEINCRKLESSELNVFSGLFNNRMFILIVVTTVVIQIGIVQYGGIIFQTTPLSLYQHLFAVAVGVGGIFFRIVFRLVPTSIFACFNLKESSLTTLDKKTT